LVVQVKVFSKKDEKKGDEKVPDENCVGGGPVRMGSGLPSAWLEWY
jgi:hypothetical protein